MCPYMSWDDEDHPDRVSLLMSGSGSGGASSSTGEEDVHPERTVEMQVAQVGLELALFIGCVEIPTSLRACFMCHMPSLYTYTHTTTCHSHPCPMPLAIAGGGGAGPPHPFPQAAAGPQDTGPGPLPQGGARPRPAGAEQRGRG